MSVLSLTFYSTSESDWCNSVIGERNCSEVFTWIDASYDVYDNTRSHIGGAISIRYGIIHGKSPKQKINVKSSTGAEMVGMS